MKASIRAALAAAVLCVSSSANAVIVSLDFPAIVDGAPCGPAACAPGGVSHYGGVTVGETGTVSLWLDTASITVPSVLYTPPAWASGTVYSDWSVGFAGHGGSSAGSGLTSTDDVSNAWLSLAGSALMFESVGFSGSIAHGAYLYADWSTGADTGTWGVYYGAGEWVEGRIGVFQSYAVPEPAALGLLGGLLALGMAVRRRARQ